MSKDRKYTAKQWSEMEGGHEMTQMKASIS